ncbi:MAG: glycosyltransferase family 9 protein [Xenococcaceae cyanobacterium MO_207.B15]|nr:glycosyltransferase family 9 protein [Xenococcaceae cyanobacterium MO_207.B15]
MRILALIPGGIGNQIYFFPTLETLKDKYPNGMIDVMVEPQSKSAYRVCKNVNSVITFDYQDRNGLADYLNILGVIRDQDYDAVISYGVPWSVQLVLWLNGIPIRISESQEKSWLISHPIPPSDQEYLPQKYHHSLEGLNIDKPCPKVKINVPQKDIDWAEAEQQRLNLKEGYVVIHSTTDTYPQKSWSEIITNIQEKQPELPIVLIQNSEIEDQWIEQIMSRNSNIKVTFPSDVGKLAAIIAGANLVLSTESSSLALALAVETYTIALCPSSVSKQILPSADDNFIIVESPTDKLADIEPKTVLEKMFQA